MCKSDLFHMVLEFFSCVGINKTRTSNINSFERNDDARVNGEYHLS